MSPAERLTPEQIAAYRQMSPGEKLAMAEQMYWDAWKSKAADVRREHPEWSEDEIEAEVRRIYFDAQSRASAEEKRIFMKVVARTQNSKSSPT